ncbi:hypothetical protein CPB97_005399, partial [Podila verticillata]
HGFIRVVLGAAHRPCLSSVHHLQYPIAPTRDIRDIYPPQQHQQQQQQQQQQLTTTQSPLAQQQKDPSESTVFIQINQFQLPITVRVSVKRWILLLDVNIATSRS